VALRTTPNPGTARSFVTRRSARVNPPLSSWATDQIERLEAASSRTRQRLGRIRMD
jgi:hypothetical protein